MRYFYRYLLVGLLVSGLIISPAAARRLLKRHRCSPKCAPSCQSVCSEALPSSISGGIADCDTSDDHTGEDAPLPSEFAADCDIADSQLVDGDSVDAPSQEEISVLSPTPQDSPLPQELESQERVDEAQIQGLAGSEADPEITAEPQSPEGILEPTLEQTAEQLVEITPEPTPEPATEPIAEQYKERYAEPATKTTVEASTDPTQPLQETPEVEVESVVELPSVPPVAEPTLQSEAVLPVPDEQQDYSEPAVENTLVEKNTGLPDPTPGYSAPEIVEPQAPGLVGRRYAAGPLALPTPAETIPTEIIPAVSSENDPAFGLNLPDEADSTPPATKNIEGLFQAPAPLEEPTPLEENELATEPAPKPTSELHTKTKKTPKDSDKQNVHADFENLFSPTSAGPVDESAAEPAPLPEETKSDESESPASGKPESSYDPFGLDKPMSENEFSQNEQTKTLAEPGGLRSVSERTWTSKSAQHQCQARLVRVTSTKVVLQRTTGAKLTVPFTQMAKTDLFFVRNQLTALQIVQLRQADAEKLANVSSR